jgi:hypothetical protein
MQADLKMHLNRFVLKGHSFNCAVREAQLDGCISANREGKAFPVGQNARFLEAILRHG